MKPTESMFLLSVAALAVLFSARVVGMASRAAGRESAGPTVSASAGRPREVDPERIGRLIREGILSDREALFYRRRGTSEALFETSRAFRALGTEAELTVYRTESQEGTAEAVLRSVEESWRGLERLLQEEMDRLRSIGTGPVKLREPVGHWLREARRFHEETRGAFDVTMVPLLDLWKRSFEEGREPTEAEVGEARSRSSWDLVEAGPEGFLKKGEGVEIDLKILARGHAVDCAVADFRSAGVAGGRVRLGGVRRSFGRCPRGPWQVDVPHPFRLGGVCARLGIPQGAVGLGPPEGRWSGGGERPRFRCPDPRTGRPVSGDYVAVVIGPNAMEVSAWAEALAILGPAGLEFLPSGKGFEALVGGGSPESPQIRATAAFREFLVSGPEF